MDWPAPNMEHMIRQSAEALTGITDDRMDRDVLFVLVDVAPWRDCDERDEGGCARRPELLDGSGGGRRDPWMVDPAAVV